MKVWIVEKGWEQERSNILGIYSSEAGALRRVTEELKYEKSYDRGFTKTINENKDTKCLYYNWECGSMFIDLYQLEVEE